MRINVILLHYIKNLGKIGSVKTVKGGFARYLIAQQMALRATKQNLAYFETQREFLEKKNRKLLTSSEALKESLEKHTIKLLRQASEAGQLYGSVSVKDIEAYLVQENFPVKSNQVILPKSIKMTGSYTISLTLHPEVTANVPLVVAKTEEEAITLLQELYKTDETLEESTADAFEAPENSEKTQELSSD